MTLGCELRQEVNYASEDFKSNEPTRYVSLFGRSMDVGSSSAASVLEKTITCCEFVVLYANPLKNRGVPTMVLSMFGIFVFKIEGSRDMADANTAKFLIATLICTSQTNRYPLSRSHK